MSSSKLIPTNPADVMVIRNVTPSIATFSVPFARFGTVRVGGRGTLVKLTSSGRLAIFSPVALTEDARAKVAEMGGDVAYIIAPDIEHHIFISEWARAFPSAKIVGPEGLPEKRAKQSQVDPEKIGGEPFAVVFTKAKKRETRIGEDFDKDFDYEYVDGHGNRELVFLWKPERVLIQADLLFNLPATEQYSRVPESEKAGSSGGIVQSLFGCLVTPSQTSNWSKRFTWYGLAKDRASFNESVRIIDKWDFATMIPCHGDVAEGNAKELFRTSFEWHLNAKE